MKKSLYFGIVLVLIFAFSLTLGFVFDSMPEMAISDQGNALTLFWVGKIAILAILVGVGIYIMLRKQDAGNSVILVFITGLLQVFPFFIRLLLRGEEPSIVWALILLFVALLGFIGLFLSIDVLNDKINKSAPKLVGKSIAVVDEDSYLDEDGRFKGAQDKKVG